MSQPSVKGKKKHATLAGDPPERLVPVDFFSSPLYKFYFMISSSVR